MARHAGSRSDTHDDAQLANQLISSVINKYVLGPGNYPALP